MSPANPLPYSRARRSRISTRSQSAAGENGSLAEVIGCWGSFDREREISGSRNGAPWMGGSRHEPRADTFRVDAAIFLVHKGSRERGKVENAWILKLSVPVRREGKGKLDSTPQMEALFPRLNPWVLFRYLLTTQQLPSPSTILSHSVLPATLLLSSSSAFCQTQKRPAFMCLPEVQITSSLWHLCPLEQIQIPHTNPFYTIANRSKTTPYWFQAKSRFQRFVQ